MKLHMDRTSIIPRLGLDPDVEADLVERIELVANLYYDNIAGIDGSTEESSGVWAEHQSYAYTLNERGWAYQSGRTKALSAAQRFMLLTASHWASKITRCLQILLKGKDDQEFTRGLGEWRKSYLVPAGMPKDSWMPRRPSGWWFRTSIHMPELFEHRPVMETDVSEA